MPKSYLSEERRQALKGNALYAVESAAADEAGDAEAAWEWLRLAQIPAPALLAAKRVNGAAWIRDHRLNTDLAEAEYGADWLDREI